MLDKIGVKYVNDYEQENSQNNYFSINTYQTTGALPLEGFTGVAYLLCPAPWKNGKQDPAAVTAGELTFTLTDNCKRLTVMKKEAVLFEQELAVIVKPLLDKHPKESNLYYVPLADLAFDVASDALKLKVVITTLYGQRTADKLEPTQTTMQVYYGVK